MNARINIKLIGGGHVNCKLRIKNYGITFAVPKGIAAKFDDLTLDCFVC